MRRSIATLAVALSAALAVSMTPSANADLGSTDKTIKQQATAAQAPQTASAVAQQALHNAQEALSGPGKAHRTADPTLALRDLSVNLPRLQGDDRRQAERLLARPTDGASDPYGDGYAYKAHRLCRHHFCIHWVSKGADAPPSYHWVKKQLRMMNHVWKFEVGKLNYRKPIKDGRRGGNGKFDVYLKDLYPKGYYGYCAAERPTSYNRYLYSGFCVLDNDFAKSQYGAPPMASATVTAAHEFFHAIQFGYDATEDSWLLETSSTWMEERYNDNSNDNRQYIQCQYQPQKTGQLCKPSQPLDMFNLGGYAQYANWLWPEYLSQHYGRGIIRKIWNKAAAFKGAPDMYSTHAIRAVLRHHKGFSKNYTKFAAGNLTPGRTYSEGSHYRSSPFVGHFKLSKGHKRSGLHRYKIHHMASKSFKFRPKLNLQSKAWRLRIRVDGPRRKKAPMAYVVVHRKHHKWDKTFIHLNRRGNGHTHVKFSRKQVKFVTVTLANASTDFHRCYTNTTFSCSGHPDYANPAFKIKGVAFKK